MSMVYLTRIESFNAAHKLWVASWSEEENRAVFGKCANHNWHGHNYKLHVTIKGIPDVHTGFVMNVKELSRIINEVIIEDLDHKNLNLDATILPKGVQPTTENLVFYIWQALEPHLSDVHLHKVELWETDKIYASYLGPKGE